MEVVERTTGIDGIILPVSGATATTSVEFPEPLPADFSLQLETALQQNLPEEVSAVIDADVLWLVQGFAVVREIEPAVTAKSPRPASAAANPIRPVALPPFWRAPPAIQTPNPVRAASPVVKTEGKIAHAAVRLVAASPRADDTGVPETLPPRQEEPAPTVMPTHLLHAVADSLAAATAIVPQRIVQRSDPPLSTSNTGPVAPPALATALVPAATVSTDMPRSAIEPPTARATEAPPPRGASVNRPQPASKPSLPMSQPQLEFAKVPTPSVVQTPQPPRRVVEASAPELATHTPAPVDVLPKANLPVVRTTAGSPPPADPPITLAVPAVPSVDRIASDDVPRPVAPQRPVVESAPRAVPNQQTATSDETRVLDPIEAPLLPAATILPAVPFAVEPAAPATVAMPPRREVPVEPVAVTPDPPVASNPPAPTRPARPIAFDELLPDAIVAQQPNADAAPLDRTTLPIEQDTDSPPAPPRAVKERDPHTRIELPENADRARSTTSAHPTPQDEPVVVPTHRRQLFVERMVDAVSAVAESGRELSIRLAPPELGPVLIEVHAEHGVITARLETHTDAARQVLSERLPQLHEALAQRGAVVDRVEVIRVEPRGMPMDGFADPQWAAAEQQARQDAREAPRRRPQPLARPRQDVQATAAVRTDVGLHELNVRI